MGREFVGGAAVSVGVAVRHLLANLPNLAHQQVNVLLLADDDLVELIQQVFGETGLDFQIGESLLGGLGVFHERYWM